MLFEVLLAVLILAIGITSSLQAFNSIVQVTSRSRDLFEAGFVLSDLTFELFALPETFADVSGGISREYSNAALETIGAYTYRAEAIEVPLPTSEEEQEADIPGVEKEEPLIFMRNRLEIANAKGVLYAIDTFHALENKE
jgi:hypothetical protein